MNDLGLLFLECSCEEENKHKLNKLSVLYWVNSNLKKIHALKILESSCVNDVKWGILTANFKVNAL